MHPHHADEVALAERTDQVLARRAALGDRLAFTEIFDRHSAALYRYALRMLDGDHQAAEDAVQEALTRAWLKIDDFRGDAALRTWLFRLTVNECHDVRRRRRPIVIEDEMLQALAPATGDTPGAHALEADLRGTLHLALAELSWRQRATWWLREIEGMSYTEIADSLETSTTVVRGQLHRARAALAVRMAQWR